MKQQPRQLITKSSSQKKMQSNACCCQETLDTIFHKSYLLDTITHEKGQAISDSEAKKCPTRGGEPQQGFTHATRGIS